MHRFPLLQKNATRYLCVLIAVAVALVMTYIALTLPDYLQAQVVTRRWFLHENTRMVETAVRAYYKMHGRLPVTIDQMKVYFPGGMAVDKASHEKMIPPGSAPVNPYSWESEWPKTETHRALDELLSSKRKSLAPGEILYVPLESDSFALVAGDVANKPYFMRKYFCR